MTPRISVIIPCYNAAAYVRQAVDSVFSQGLSEVEVIIVDDGSTDATPDIIRSYGVRVQSIRTDNRGVSAARNEGTRRARGVYLQYLDADDWLLPGALAKRLKVLEETQADVAYSDWQRWEEKENGRFVEGPLLARSLPEYSLAASVALFRGLWWPPVALFYRKTIVDRVGPWREYLKLGEDARFALDASLLGGRFVHVPEVGAAYRSHRAGSLSCCDPAYFVSQTYRSAHEVQRWLEERGTFGSEWRLAFIETYKYTARTFFTSDYALFQENLRRLYAIEPQFSFSWAKMMDLCSRTVGYGLTSRVLKAYRQIRLRLSKGEA